MADLNTYDLRHHPGHAAAIGSIVAAWNAVEYELCALYTFMLRAPPWQARLTFYSLYNNKARIDMCRALIDTKMHDHKMKASLRDMLGRVNIAAGKRNKYAHNPWLIDWDTHEPAKSPVYLVEEWNELSPHGKYRAVKVEELTTVHGLMRKTVMELTGFVQGYGLKFPLIVQPGDVLGPSLYKFAAQPARRPQPSAPRRSGRAKLLPLP